MPDDNQLSQFTAPPRAGLLHAAPSAQYRLTVSEVEYHDGCGEFRVEVEEMTFADFSRLLQALRDLQVHGAGGSR